MAKHDKQQHNFITAAASKYACNYTAIMSIRVCACDSLFFVGRCFNHSCAYLGMMGWVCPVQVLEIEKR